MNKTMKGLIMFLCVFTFMATMPMDGWAAMGAKPQIRGMATPGSRASFTCENNTCRCDGLSDCMDMSQSGVCKGKIDCSDGNCMCHYGSSKSLQTAPKSFKNFRQ